MVTSLARVPPAARAVSSWPATSTVGFLRPASSSRRKVWEYAASLAKSRALATQGAQLGRKLRVDHGRSGHRHLPARGGSGTEQGKPGRALSATTRLGGFDDDRAESLDLACGAFEQHPGDDARPVDGAHLPEAAVETVLV